MSDLIAKVLEFLEDVASDMGGGQGNYLLGSVLRTCLATTWGQATLGILRRQTYPLGRWAVNSPAVEKLAVVFGICFLATAGHEILTGIPTPIGMQLALVGVIVYMILVSLYRTGKTLCWVKWRQRRNT